MFRVTCQSPRMGRVSFEQQCDWWYYWLMGILANEHLRFVFHPSAPPPHPCGPRRRRSGERFSRDRGAVPLYRLVLLHFVLLNNLDLRSARRNFCIDTSVQNMFMVALRLWAPATVTFVGVEAFSVWRRRAVGFFCRSEKARRLLFVQSRSLRC